MHRYTPIVTAAVLAAAIVAGFAHAATSASLQRFTFAGRTVHGKDLPIHVSAAGPITATGTARVVESPKTTTGAFVFPRGDVDVRFVHGPTHAHPDLAKCRATIDARGTYTISGGTGAYARIAGAGTYTETRVLVGARSSSGSCIGGPTSTPASVTAVAHMTGTLTFP